MSGPGQGNAHASGGLLTAPRPSAPYQRAAPRYKGFCEIAISPFDTSQLVHASDGDRRSQKHDVVRLPPPEHVSDASWIRHTTNVRLISGCTVLMERDIASNVDHMHMLQVPQQHAFVFAISNSPTPLSNRSGVHAATRAQTSFSLNSCRPPSNAARHRRSGIPSLAARIPSRHAPSFQRRRLI